MSWTAQTRIQQTHTTPD